MYKDSEIGFETYQKYDNLINLFKRKGASSAKLDDLELFLNYFNNNFESFNIEEKKLIKNVLMISKSIISKSNSSSYKHVKEKKEICINLMVMIEEKQKEPIK